MKMHIKRLKWLDGIQTAEHALRYSLGTSVFEHISFWAWMHEFIQSVAFVSFLKSSHRTMYFTIFILDPSPTPNTFSKQMKLINIQHDASAKA